jgi:LmbE family N-acetylglucosaminyl deacetylase
MTTSSGTLLGVWAHPDDECYLSAGLMAQAVRDGRRVVCVTATRGEAGVTDETRWPAAELAGIRERELQQSLRELGVTEHQFLGLPDGGCAVADPEPLIDDLAALMAELRPSVVVTFGPEGITDHDDHKAVSRWTTEAHRRVGGAWSQQLWYPTYPFDWEPVWGDELRTLGVYPPGFPHLVHRDDLAAAVTLDADLLDRKYAALLAQRSQVEGLIAALTPERYRAFLAEECFRFGPAPRRTELRSPCSSAWPRTRRRTTSLAPC